MRDKPVLDDRLGFYWNAFWTLHGSRQSGPMPIQVSEVDAYCRLCGFSDPLTRYDLLLMVQAMDGAWLDLKSKG